MALPVNTSALIKGRVVEWERLEFKRGWNPEEIMHTVCAFANDINNWGGGYIIVGIQSVNGIPQFPPEGVPLGRLDRIQGELTGICYKIQPNFLPISQPFEEEGKHILVIWCPAGDMRPYSCPSTLGDDARRQYYIRSGSRTIVAQGSNQTRLIELTAKVPFDDRINQQADIKHLELGLIREFLQQVGSELFEESESMPFADLCKAMQIARGPAESLRPVNSGLMFFNSNPHLFFERAWIEVVVHKDDSGRNFVTKEFKGPLHKQIINCLEYLKTEVIRTETRKQAGKAESIIISNYPYNAIEEAICNAVYHKSYADNKPIEIQVLPDRIEILSFPGPMPPVTNADLQQRRVIARDYRNRRVGDFLKELKLTEGKATGIPLIRDQMSMNGNPEPVFYTDEERTLFLVTLPCHPDWRVTMSVTKLTRRDVVELLAEPLNFQLLNRLLNSDISDVVEDIRDLLKGRRVTESLTKSVTMITELIDFLAIERSREEIFRFLEIDNQTKNFNTNIKPLMDYGIIEKTVPDKPRSRNQKYRLTAKGRKLLIT
jgi:ATP-dependent DNA helicase RecG